MDRELLIAAGPGEWRAALLESGVAVELYVERGDRAEAGSIHLGRVRRLAPALGAALVDIGGQRPAFLPQAETVPRGDRLHEGQRVLVQIRRESQGGKAARVTMAVRLRAQGFELIVGRGAARPSPAQPWRAGFPLSRNAGEGAEQSEEGEGEAGLGSAAEAATLARHWDDILYHAARADPPVRLDPVASFAAALAASLPGPPNRIYVDDPGAIPDLRAAFSGAAVEPLPEADWPIDLDAVFEEALSETIAGPGGGSVHFESTRAGVLIDVDTGSPETGSPERTGLRANLAAAAVIARQIRLRNLGGGIVVDFVGLDSRASRDRVRAALAEHLAPDPARPQVLGWTRLGHLELVRPRRGRPLAEALLESRPGGALVKTAVTVAHEGLRALRREARAQPGRQWRLTAAPEVAAVLAGGAAPAVQEAERRFARRIAIEADPSFPGERFQIAAL